MRSLKVFELALMALAVVSGSVVMGAIWLGGFIAPESVGVDLAIYFGMLALVAGGALLDVFSRMVGGRVTGLTLLSLGTIALAVWFALSFIVSFGPPVLFAFVAMLLGWIRLADSRVARLPAR